jgi:hypothetical protein
MRLMRSVINTVSSLVPCRMSIGNTADYRFLVYWAHQRAMIMIGQSLSHFVFAKVTLQHPNATISCAGAVTQNLYQSPKRKPTEDSRQRQLDGMSGGLPA